MTGDFQMLLMSLDDIRLGMVVGFGLRNKDGQTLLGAGVALTSEYIERLRELGYYAVWIDDEDTRDIVVEDALSETTRQRTTAAIQETFSTGSREAQKLRSVSVEQVRATLENRRFHQVFSDNGTIERLSSQVDLVVEEVLSHAVLTGLGSLKTHTSYTYHHCLDVAVTATMIGRLLGYDRETLKKLAVGCMLHDIGCIFMDGEALDTPGLGAAAEASRVREHAVLGYLFIRDGLRLGPLPAHIAYQHHERQNGTGYPRALTGTNRIVQGAEMHLPGRITPLAEVAAIADFHDFCASNRAERVCLAPDQVRERVTEATGQHLNRDIVAEFLTILAPYPVGTQITVTQGRFKNHIGVVVRLNHDAMDRPVIRLLGNPTGDRIPPIDLDLRKEDLAIQGLVSADAALAVS